MGKIWNLLLASPLFFASGCLCPYWVSPSVNYVPATRVSERNDSVHAFRVDTRESTPYFPGPLHQTHQLTAISIDGSGEVPGQLSVSCTRGFLAFFVALNYVTWHQDTISVRLYRPGFETVELRAWAATSAVQWRTAAGVAEQCKAVDDLVAGNLEPGGIAKEHQIALLFAADEYRRLAALISNQNPQMLANRQDILDKAEKLEKRASESSQRGWVERLID
jgi:hypothetical protein